MALECEWIVLSRSMNGGRSAERLEKTLNSTDNGHDQKLFNPRIQ
jgi:hypothetical protein